MPEETRIKETASGLISGYAALEPLNALAGGEFCSLRYNGCFPRGPCCLGHLLRDCMYNRGMKHAIFATWGGGVSRA